MCVFTVASDTNRAAAISSFDSPATRCARTSASRAVNPSGRARQRRLRAFRRPGRPRHREPVPAVQRVEQPSLHRRVELRVPGRHVGDGAQDLLGAGVLGQEAAGARLQRGEHPGVVGVRGQHDDGGLGPQPPEPLGRLDPVAPGHVQVHQDDVRPQLQRLPDGVVAVDRGADDGDPGQQAQQRHQPFPHDLLVVGDEDLDIRAFPFLRVHPHPTRSRGRTRLVGRHSATRNPSPVGPAVSVPPSNSARSRIPVSP